MKRIITDRASATSMMTDWWADSLAKEVPRSPVARSLRRLGHHVKPSGKLYRRRSSTDDTVLS